jgi:hypothetical protein
MMQTPGNSGRALLDLVYVASEGCAAGYSGTACRDCVRPGYYRLGDVCKACPQAAYAAIALFALVFGECAQCTCETM